MKNGANDKIYLETDVPERKLPIMEKAVREGLFKARKRLNDFTPARIRFWVLPRIRDGLLCKGSASRGFMNIGITKKHLQGRTAVHSIAQMVIHEYVHMLRQHQARYRATRVIETVVEEGIATYIETALAGAPAHLDLKTLNERSVRDYWNKFSSSMNRPTRRYPQLARMLAYRVALYRLGHGIIRRYMKAHRLSDLSMLLRTPNGALVRFAHRSYGKVV